MVQESARSSAVAGSEPFTRDGTTWLSYSALGAYTFWLYAFGPALALLRTELGFSYTMISVYSAVWAAGSILAGVVFAPMAAALGRRPLLAWSALVTISGAALFTLTRSLPITLLGAVIMGLAGTTVQTTTQSVLADRHGPRRDQALVEMNIGAGICAVVAPLALGLSQATTSTWRTAMALPAVAMIVLTVVYRHQPLPTPSIRPLDTTGTGGTKLSGACRALSLLVAVGIGVEFAVVYFGTELLTAASGLSVTAAAAAMTLFYAGILLGRVAGAALTRRPGRTAALLALSLAVTLAGLIALWLADDAPLALLGLFVAGLGIANQFPLALALTMAAAPGNTDAANALTQLLGGILVLAAPFLLGFVADHRGLATGFAVAPVLTAMSGILLYIGFRGEHVATPIG